MDLKRIEEDKELDRMFDEGDTMFREGRFNEYNTILTSLSIEKIKTVHLIGYLTISHWARNHLPYRQKFFENVSTELKSRPNYTANLLSGLE